MQNTPERPARVGLAELERREEALKRRVVREQQVEVCLQCVCGSVFYFILFFSKKIKGVVSFFVIMIIGYQIYLIG